MNGLAASSSSSTACDIRSLARAERGDRGAKSGSAIACAEHVVTGISPRASLYALRTAGKQLIRRSMQFRSLVM
jgi:hypothetical protein